MWKVIAMVLLIPVVSVLNGWVLSILWGWFIVGLFGLPVLTIAPAIGVGLVVTFLTHQHVENKNRDGDADNELARVLGYTFGRLFGTLLVGWIVTLFM